MTMLRSRPSSSSPLVVVAVALLLSPPVLLDVVGGGGGAASAAAAAFVVPRGTGGGGGSDGAAAAFRAAPLRMADSVVSTVAVEEQEQEEVVVVEESPPAVEVDPKVAAKLFGKLAEKYIMLDASGGMCCYSACSDCEYRNPDGGYIMADQSSSRPKWIPTYERRTFESSGKDHTSKWSCEIFTDGPVVTRDEFVSAVSEMKFATPLGGPYVSASAANKIDDVDAAGTLFDVLTGGEKDKLTKHRMSVKMKEISKGEEGLTWPSFSKALGVP